MPNHLTIYIYHLNDATIVSEHVIGIEQHKSLTRWMTVEGCTETFLVEVVANEADATAQNKQSIESANLPKSEYDDGTKRFKGRP